MNVSTVTRLCRAAAHRSPLLAASSGGRSSGYISGGEAPTGLRPFTAATAAQPLEMRFYFDYRSPFSYLAKDAVYALEDGYPARLRVEWLPFAFPVEQAFGLPESRGRYHLNKVKYAYIDVRRWANERNPPLVIRGPQRVFDSTCASVGGLFAQSAGQSVFRAYTDEIFRGFFERRLNIEDEAIIFDVLRSAIEKEAKSDAKHGWEERWASFSRDESNVRQKLSDIREKGEAEGVFGVPSFVVGGDLFFGNDRFHWVRRRVEELLSKS